MQGTRKHAPGDPDPGPDRRRERQPDRELARVRALARVLDRYGLDPLLGFVLPGAGDLVGSLLGLYIVGIAVRRGLPKVILARMLLNLGVDMLIGVVPLVGDLGDLVFKANLANVALLEERPAGRAPRPSDWAVVVGAALAFVAAIALVGYLLVRVIRAIA